MTAKTIAIAICLLYGIGTAMAEVNSRLNKARPSQVKPERAGQAPAKKPQVEAKEVSGMSVVGNSEAPKSLTIIPWKSSEIGRDSEFKSSLLSQELVPIDKPTFRRELDFYKLSNRN